MADDRSRWSPATRLEALERHARDLTRVVAQQRERMKQLRETVEGQQRLLRDLRARLEQIDQRERWVDSYRADTRDPYAGLSAELEEGRQ